MTGATRSFHLERRPRGGTHLFYPAPRAGGTPFANSATTGPFASGKSSFGQLAGRNPRKARLPIRLRLGLDGLAIEIMELDEPVRVLVVDYSADRQNPHPQPGLFLAFAQDRRVGRFRRFAFSAGELPTAGHWRAGRSGPATYEITPKPRHECNAHLHHGSWRIALQAPRPLNSKEGMTRRPENSDRARRPRR